MIKKLIALCSVLALMISTVGCVTVGFNSHGGRNYSHDKDGEIQGSGDFISESFAFGDFNKLRLELNCELYFTVGEPDLRVELHENFVQYLNVSTDNGTLAIESTKYFNTDTTKNVTKIYVSAPSLEELIIDDVVSIKEMDTITADTFKLDIIGVFNGAIDFAVKNLTVDMDGVSNLTLTGTADNAVIEMSGMGNLSAFDLHTRVMDIETAGMGSAEVNCSEKLIAEVSGMGGIQYKGNPSVEPNVSGMGGIKKAD